MIVMCAQSVFRNMQVQDEELVALEGAERIHETHFALADGFDLRAGELDAGGIFLQQEVLEVSLLVFDADGFGDWAHNSAKFVIFFIGTRITLI
jgi:hypothetical protein